MRTKLFELDNAKMIIHNRMAFEEFYFHLYKQEIMGILCDSIIERNAFLDMCSGQYNLIDGSMFFIGQRVQDNSLSKTIQQNISVIRKKSKIISTLSIIENICIFSDKNHWINQNNYRLLVAQCLQRFHLSIDLAKDVSSLSEKDRVIIELVKAYLEQRKLIVLSDLSGFLQKAELEEIHSLIMSFRNEGRSFIIIEPFDDILFNWCDELLVIKNGKDLACFKPDSIDKTKLYSYLIANTPISHLSSDKSILFEDTVDPIFSFNAVSTSYFQSISFSIGKGEILKVFCLDQKSMDEFKNIIYGYSKLISGNILLNSSAITIKSIKNSIKKGILYSCESPYKTMLIKDMSIRDNLMLDMAMKVNGLWINPHYRKNIDQYIDEQIGHNIAGKKLLQLSPSMLQTIVYTKFLLYYPSVLFCERPFTEVDLHIRSTTIEMLDRLQRKGISIIILTMSLSELNIVNGDTIYIKDGAMVDEDTIYQSLYER